MRWRSLSPLLLLSKAPLPAPHEVMHPVTLVTFDVDGTLVRGSADAPDVTIHAKAFLHAVGKVVNGDDSFETKHSTPLDIIPPHNYHGCTDGLISLHIAKHAFNVPAADSSLRLAEVFDVMHHFVNNASDEEIRRTIVPIPGVLERLTALSASPEAEHLLCGLVTGNVEGIARKKMRATGIFQTGILSPPSSDQNQKSWPGTDDAAFLGGFGSDYCSNDITDITRQYKDRGEQIALAYNRALDLIKDKPSHRIVRVVHVGDAPADVLAAKYCADEQRFGSDVVCGCVAVATGTFSCEELREVCGERFEGKWEPVVLEEGVADEQFVKALAISTSR